MFNRENLFLTKAALLFGCAFAQRNHFERERLVRKISWGKVDTIYVPIHELPTDIVTSPLHGNNQVLAQSFSSFFEPAVAIPRSRPLESSSI